MVDLRLLLLASAVNYMDRMTLASVSRRLIEELHLSNTDYGAIEQYFGYAFAVGSILFGLLVDKVSVRWLYPLVLALWSLMGLLTGLVPAVGTGELARAAAGADAVPNAAGLLSSRGIGRAPQNDSATARAAGPYVRQQHLAERHFDRGDCDADHRRGDADRGARWRQPFFGSAARACWVVGWLWATRNGIEQTAASAETEAGGWTASLGRPAQPPLLAAGRGGVLHQRRLFVYRVWLPWPCRTRRAWRSAEETLSRILPFYYFVNDVGCLAGALLRCG
ncbi:MAG: hypothetical protein R2724_20270 [Bryobacterales bacterium]